MHVQRGISTIGALALAAACAGPRPAPPPPAATTPTPPPRTWKPGDPIPSLAGAYQGQFLVGSAVTPGLVLMGDSHLLLEQQFAVVTLEDAMKPVVLSRREGTYDFNMADQVVEWAVKNGIKVRGHCLVWHQQAAPWMFTRNGKPVSRAVLIQRLRRYIHDVVGHYKGKIWAWDVVQEAVVAGEPGVEAVDGWRASEWYRIIGPEYVELAFTFAHEADPDALLVYNDYETESPAKRELIVRMVKSLQAKGVPVHAVGHQSHLYAEYPEVSELERSIQAIAALGLRNQITELDVSLRPRFGAPMPDQTPEVIAQHARRYGELFRMFRRNRAAIDAVVLWGVNDESSWRRAPDAPLLFSELQPKDAFWEVVDAASAP
jgi:endo-1,4-beta-xylanase